MDSREVTGWAVWERLHGPLGPERLDYLAAAVQATLANVNRGKRQKAFKPVDFAPPWADRKRWPWSDREDRGPMTGEEILRTVKGITRRMGGKDG